MGSQIDVSLIKNSMSEQAMEGTVLIVQETEMGPTANDVRKTSIRGRMGIALPVTVMKLVRY